MGRQKGDPNRSKNRPSSSSAAASLLQSSKGIPAGFGGYVGSSRLDVSDVQDNELPWDVDSEAALHLRRLSKKDSTTRMKALKALITLFKERPANELCQLLPTWIFEYKKLVHDDNQQVREYTHNAMLAISTTVGRGLAPHIRTLMGAWWVSQFDPAKEVSTASQQSFQAAFQGPSKRLEALMFCATDILSYIDSLLKLSPQTISEKLVPIEESTKKYELVISSALLALAAFLDAILQGWRPISTLGNDNIEPNKEKPGNKRIQEKERTKEIEDSAAKLCLNYKHFRDFLKSKSSQIRCASYQALYSFARNIPATFSAKDLEDNAGIVLGSFAEKDPSCHRAMWDMILYFSKRYPEIWNTSATNKFIMPRLFSFLRHATYGSAKVSYPCILPLLSLLPSQTMNLSVQFLKDLFSSLWDGRDLCHLGLENEIVYLKTFQECFLWAINNADRFSAGHESSLVDGIQGYMMENVFIEILWKNYTFCGFQAPSDSLPPAVAIKNKNNASKGALEATHKKHKERYSNEFIEKLRNCMIDILVILAAKSRTVVRSFWKLFPEICFQAITFEASQMIASTSAVRIGCAQRISEFLSLIGGSSPSDEFYKHDILDIAVRPLVDKLFPFVKIMEFGDAILLLAAIVSTFGPLSFHVPKDREQGEVFNSDLNEVNNKDLDQFVFFMEKNLIPWCLEPCKFCLAEKVDLLLSFFEDKRLTSKWNSVIFQAVMINDTESDSGELHSGKIAVLSVLLERFRLKFLDLDNGQSCSSQGTRQWDLSGLDGAAVIIARSLSLSDPSALLFLRQVLGGSKRTILRLLVAPETVGTVIKILLQRFVYILLNSGKEWACFAAAQLSMPDLDQPLSVVEDKKAASLAFAAAQALCENITDLQFVNEPEATTKVVASFYCIQWAFNSEHFLDEEEEEENVQIDYEGKGEENPPILGTDLGSRGIEDGIPEDCAESPVDHGFMAESVKQMVRNISLILSSGYPGRLTTSIRIGVQRIMIQCIRYAALEGTTDGQKMAYVCSNWITTLMDELCMKAEDTQVFLDMLLEPTVAWPLYASKPSKSKNCTVSVEERLRLSSEKVKHERFSALIGKMAMLLGWEKLVGDQRTETAESCQQLTSKGKSLELEEHCRIWLVIEMLCTWFWPGGGATDSLLPYLMACVDNDQNFSDNIVDSVIYSLFIPAKSKEKVSNFSNKYWLGSIDNLEDCEDRCLHALLFLLSKICQADKKVEYSEKLFQMLVVEQGYLEDPLSCAGLKILPFILSILVPALRKKQDRIDPSIRNPITLEVAVLKWLGAAYSAPPLYMHNGFVPDLENALQVVVACFPLHSAGGSVAVMAAASANVSTEEKSLLKSLMQKEASEVAGFVAHVAKQYASQSENSIQKKDARQFHEEILAKLIASSIVYCWKQFSNQEWAIVTQHMRKWMEAALIEIGNFTELVNSTILEKKGSKELPLSILEKITAGIETIYGKKSDLSWTAAIIFSLLEALQCSTFTESQSSTDRLELFNWKEVKDRALNYMAQMFFASGMSEALASDSIAGDAAANLVASYHMSNIQFWEVVSEILLGTSTEERKGIGHHLNTWTVGKDPIRSLYALLFSSQPIGRMQHAAFSLLTRDPFQTLAVTCREMKVGPAEDRLSTESPSLTDTAVRPELSRILEISPAKIHESALMSSIRVRYFLAWAIILSYLGSISVSSEVGQKLVQYIQDSALSSTILDSILQHIPLNPEQGSYKKKASSLCQAEMGKIGDAARRACAVRTATFAIEELWPVDQHTVSSLAAALYGLLLQVLPAFVRVWFAGLRDRSVASSVEYFTTKFCSPLLLADEFAQVHTSAIQDDSLTIKANQGLGEITVIYKKEEAGMDMTIKLPKCYPLKAVDIDCTRRLGVSETRLRKWTLSMAAFLRNQNGAVAEAIQIWRQNVDREFEGVEECPICYSIIHTANHSLPKLACKTCKHKFHAPCLYKWFSTSHKSTCPLCQTPF